MQVKYTRPMDPMGKYIVFQSASFPLNHWRNDNWSTFPHPWWDSKIWSMHFFAIFLVFRACRALFLHITVAKKHCEGSQTVFVFKLEPKTGLGEKGCNYHLMTQFSILLMHVYIVLKGRSLKLSQNFDSKFHDVHTPLEGLPEKHRHHSGHSPDQLELLFFSI